MAFSGSQRTRFVQPGWMGQRAGSFAGKAFNQVLIVGTLHRRRQPHLTTRDSVRDAQRGSERYWGL